MMSFVCRLHFAVLHITTGTHCHTWGVHTAWSLDVLQYMCAICDISCSNDDFIWLTWGHWTNDAVLVSCDDEIFVMHQNLETETTRSTVCRLLVWL